MHARHPLASPLLTPLLILGISLAGVSSLAATAAEVDGSASPTPSEAAPSHQIRVELFGQPCLLQGPQDVDTLKKIHSFSPEQVQAQHSPRYSIADQKQLRTLQEKLPDTQALPPTLDRYREKLTKRVDAQVAFFDTADEALKARKPALLTKLAEQNCGKSAAQEIEKVVSHGNFTAQKLGALFEIYVNAIEAEPDEEFHRAIHRLGVQYVCSFEEAPKTGGLAHPANPVRP